MTRMDTTTLPLAPILLLDDVVIAGHYAHSPAPAPLGHWLVIPADVAGLMELAEEGARPESLDPADVGAYRLIGDCLAARLASRRLA